MKKRSQLPYSNEDGSCAYCGFNPEEEDIEKLLEIINKEINRLKNIGEDSSFVDGCLFIRDIIKAKNEKKV